MAASSTVPRVDVTAGFSGVVRVDDDAVAYGMANRAAGVANTFATRFAIASGTKPLTALTVVSLIEDGVLELTTPARSLLGPDLPLVDDGVTVEHLLAHRSGIGDYIDESGDGDVDDHVLAVPVHTLVTTEDYLAVLDGHPAKGRPDAEFAYCNSGYVILALLAERSTGRPFAELVRERVCEPAGLERTAFLRSDELPGDAAVGYLDEVSDRTNVFHLPVLGSGDGGLSSTVGDVHRLWRALDAGRIVPPDWVGRLISPRGDVRDGAERYGLGFWLPPAGRPGVILEGYDAGVSFRSVHVAGGLTWTVASNMTDGAWPVARRLASIT